MRRAASQAALKATRAVTATNNHLTGALNELLTATTNSTIAAAATAAATWKIALRIGYPSLLLTATCEPRRWHMRATRPQIGHRRPADPPYGCSGIDRPISDHPRAPRASRAEHGLSPSGWLRCHRPRGYACQEAQRHLPPCARPVEDSEGQTLTGWADRHRPHSWLAPTGRFCAGHRSGSKSTTWCCPAPRCGWANPSSPGRRCTAMYYVGELADRAGHPDAGRRRDRDRELSNWPPGKRSVLPAACGGMPTRQVIAKDGLHHCRQAGAAGPGMGWSR